MRVKMKKDQVEKHLKAGEKAAKAQNEPQEKPKAVPPPKIV